MPVVHLFTFLFRTLHVQLIANKVKEQRAVVVRCKEERKVAFEAARAAEEEKKEEEEAKKHKLENSIPLSDKGLRVLVSKRLQLQNKFDNKSDKNEQIWVHIALLWVFR